MGIKVVSLSMFCMIIFRGLLTHSFSQITNEWVEKRSLSPVAKSAINRQAFHNPPNGISEPGTALNIAAWISSALISWMSPLSLSNGKWHRFRYVIVMHLKSATWNTQKVKRFPPQTFY